MLALHFLLFTAALLIIDTSCVSLPKSHTGSIQWVDCKSNVPQPLQGTKLPNPLPSTLHCGRLDVPMDYAKPISARNKISLGFSMYRPDHPKGLINFNPGGPGLEVASFAWRVAVNSSREPWFAGLGQYDILGMDVRGTHSSNPLNCSIGTFEVPSSIPSNEASFKSYQAAVTTYAQSCINNSTPKGIVAHVGTHETVQDWNSLRKALGYERFHFLAISYGTFGAAAYAHKYPQHVGHFVLDAIYPYALPKSEVVDQIKAANRLLLRADAFCMYDQNCPFHAEGKGSVVKAFSTVLNRAIAGDYPNITADDIRAVMSEAFLSGIPNFAALNNVLGLAVNGNASAFSYDISAFSRGWASILPFSCLDTYIGDNTFAGFEKIRKRIAKDDTAQIRFSADRTVVALCSGWPYHGDSNKPKYTESAFLLVTSDFDLDTATEMSTTAWKQAPNSALVVRHGDGHSSFFLPGAVQTAEIDFLMTGNLPKAKNETLVTIYSPHSERGPIEDPYEAPIGPLAGDMSDTGELSEC